MYGKYHTAFLIFPTYDHSHISLTSSVTIFGYHTQAFDAEEIEKFEVNFILFTKGIDTVSRVYRSFIYGNEKYQFFDHDLVQAIRFVVTYTKSADFTHSFYCRLVDGVIREIVKENKKDKDYLIANFRTYKSVNEIVYYSGCDDIFWFFLESLVDCYAKVKSHNKFLLHSSYNLEETLLAWVYERISCLKRILAHVEDKKEVFNIIKQFRD